MNIRIVKRLIAFVALAAVVSCGNEPEVEIVPPESEGRLTLEVGSESSLLEMNEEGSRGEVRLLSRGGEVAIDVLTNSEEWSWSADGAEWLTISADSYFLTLTADRNEGDKERNATITITASKGKWNAAVEIAVSQNHSGMAEVALDRHELRLKAHTELVQTVGVDCNVDEWSFESNCSWLLLERTEEGLRLTADNNTTEQQRTAEVIVRAGSGTAAADRLIVSQDGTAYLRLSTASVSADGEGATRNVVIDSNPELEWNFTTDGSAWFSAAKVDETLVVSVESNGAGGQREGYIEIVVGEEDNSASARLKVMQIGADTEALIYEVEITTENQLIIAAPVLTSASGGKIEVDWGDGSEKESFESRRGTHTYRNPGLYTISITGEATSLAFGDGEDFAPEVKNIISWGKLGYTSMADACLGCNNLESIPADVAGSFAGVKSFLGAFSCCESLKEIPAGLFRYATVAKNFEDCFSHSGAIEEIPADLFANCAAAERFINCFYATGTGYVITSNTLPNFEEVSAQVRAGRLKSIPEGLFANCPKAERFEYVFGATAIEEVPAGIFAANSEATMFTGAFSACVNLERVAPEFMSKAVAATDIKYMFAGCSSLVDIPVGMFKNNAAVTNLEYIFYKTGVKKLSKGLFEGLTNVRTIGAVFQDCVELSELEEGLFDGLDSAVSFRYCFSGCTALKSVPEGLFAGRDKAYDFTYLFESSAIESIPVGLFAEVKDSSSVDFSYAFSACMGLKSVPVGLFDRFTTVTSPGFKNAFEASGLERVPEGLFAKNVKVSTGFENTFYKCAHLQTIEGPIFPATTTVTSLAYTFGGCTALEELPAGLFDALGESKVKYTATFKGCTALRELPEELFAANTAATQFSETFSGCTALESIPANLMGSKEKTTTLKSLFKDCTSLTSVPEGIFAQMPAVTSFEQTFSGCTAIKSIPADLFAAIGTKTSSITLKDCFHNCSSLETLPASLFDTVRRISYIDGCFDGCSSLTGESPYTIIFAEDGTEQKVHLYERTRGDEFPAVPSSSSAHADCFAGCKGLSDYDDMPSSWR